VEDALPASVCSYLGIQDASRKRRQASKTPGAWAGTVILTDADSVYLTVSQEKWEKSRGMVADTLQELEASDGSLDQKTLERCWGFFLYVTRTYPAMVPYLKGMHLTLDGWRDGRDSEGWKITGREARLAQEAGVETGCNGDVNCPKGIKGKPCLLSDMAALLELFSALHQPKRQVRSKHLIEVYYGFGDVSQDGFGFNIKIDGRI
jgi:hypothetical protein